MENSTEVSKKTENRTTIWQSNSAPVCVCVCVCVCVYKKQNSKH